MDNCLLLYFTLEKLSAQKHCLECLNESHFSTGSCCHFQVGKAAEDEVKAICGILRHGIAGDLCLHICICAR